MIPKKNDPYFSVIIPTFNRANFVPEAIKSVLEQTFTDYEIIVINDGSTDGTETALHSYVDRIRYIHQENQGVSAARNVGIHLAKGGWLAFLDSDDIWMPNKLELQFTDISLHPEIDLHICNGEFINDPYIDKTLFELRGLDREGWNTKLIKNPYFHLFKFHYSMLSSVVVKNKPIFFEEKIQNLEDFLFMAMHALQANTWMLRNDKLVQFIRRIEDNSVSLTQRDRYDLKKTLQVRCTMAQVLERYIDEHANLMFYMEPLNKFLSDSFFSYAINIKNPDERQYYLKKGLFANFTLKNLIKFIFYFYK